MKFDPARTLVLCVNPPPGGPADISVADIIAAAIAAVAADAKLAGALAASLAPHFEARVRPT